MFALERLIDKGAGCRPQFCWTRQAVCANEGLLIKIRNAQRQPENWRVRSLPTEHALFLSRPRECRFSSGGKERLWDY